MQQDGKGGEKFEDLSLPGTDIPLGTRHPLRQVENKIVEIFERLGFGVAEGPEIEDDWHNFTSLNMPEDHTARDMQDTFYVAQNPDWLLRTHTSSVQARVLEEGSLPVRVICPGRVYRNETISARAHCFFHQCEGLYIDEQVSFADLKQTLYSFVTEMFGPNTKVRFRPSYFPFTEPSAEMDISCTVCGGSGCSLCKHTGWVEILGCGMVHPDLLRNFNIDPEKYSGFAFGMGVERITQVTVWPLPWLAFTGSAPAARRRGGHGSPGAVRLRPCFGLRHPACFLSTPRTSAPLMPPMGPWALVMGLMTWLWISAIVILLGAELNAEMEHQTARDTTTGHPKSLGTRGAKMADNRWGPPIVRDTIEGAVVAVAADSEHRFSKPVQDGITLVKGHGVDGDAHAGEYVRHRYAARRHPRLPNLRQVHLIPSELFATVREAGYDIGPGQLGENIPTAGLDLEKMPLGTRIELGPTAVVELTGLRTPCVLIDRFRTGLKKAGRVVGKNGPCIQMRRLGRGANWRTGGSRRSCARHPARRMSEASSFAVAPLAGPEEPKPLHLRWS